MRSRIVVTGMGALSPVGNSVSAMWDALIAGRSGAGPITHFDARNLDTHFAAEVKDFDPLNVMDKKEARRSSRYVQFAMAALREAAQFYVQIYKMGFHLEFVDVGGGLGVDYDGTRSANSGMMRPSTHSATSKPCASQKSSTRFEPASSSS